MVMDIPLVTIGGRIMHIPAGYTTTMTGTVTGMGVTATPWAAPVMAAVTDTTARIPTSGPVDGNLHPAPLLFPGCTGIGHGGGIPAPQLGEFTDIINNQIKGRHQQ